jgi:hypothetical protein
MSGKRSQTVAQIQDKAMVRMKIVHRRHEPGPSPQSISDPVFARLVVLEAAEATVHLARLSRMAHGDLADSYWRQLVVITNAVVDAIAGDLRGDPDSNTEALYRRVIAQEGD